MCCLLCSLHPRCGIQHAYAVNHRDIIYIAVAHRVTIRLACCLASQIHVQGGTAAAKLSQEHRL